ncbi:MAG TPA: hypothetical protein VLG40_01675 [Candidatus Saccharimonas sp.]|nr:hypothetical protein [Candidatus Saccharimonas sp.]
MSGTPQQNSRLATIKHVLDGYQNNPFLGGTPEEIKGTCLAWADDMALELREIGKLAESALDIIHCGGTIPGAREALERGERLILSSMAVRIINSSETLRQMLHEGTDAEFVENMRKLSHAFSPLPGEEF